jgi:hypothetical protein
MKRKEREETIKDQDSEEEIVLSDLEDSDQHQSKVI